MEPLVLVVGDTAVDLVVRMEWSSVAKRQPCFQTPELRGGGSAANVAVALARLRTQTAFLGCFGDDFFGRFLMRDLQSEHVDVSASPIARDAPTSLVFAFISPEGERTALGWPRQGAAYTRLEPTQIDAHMIARSAWLHTSGLCLTEDTPLRKAVLEAMRLARKHDLPISLDLNLRASASQCAGRFREAVEQAIDLSDYVLGSGPEEIAPLLSSSSVEAAATSLAERGPTVVARMGEEGAIAVTPQDTAEVPGFAVNVVDTLGAGDAFDGGFIAALLSGADMTTAVRWGNAVAALKVARGSARGVPTKGELLAFLERHTGERSSEGAS
jgi:sugar/nucleoside kinase (ribokinase family)